MISRKAMFQDHSHDLFNDGVLLSRKGLLCEIGWIGGWSFSCEAHTQALFSGDLHATVMGTSSNPGVEQRIPRGAKRQIRNLIGMEILKS